jgi:hypothetical protein
VCVFLDITAQLLVFDHKRLIAQRHMNAIVKEDGDMSDATCATFNEAFVTSVQSNRLSNTHIVIEVIISYISLTIFPYIAGVW